MSDVKDDSFQQWGPPLPPMKAAVREGVASDRCEHQLRRCRRTQLREPCFRGSHIRGLERSGYPGKIFTAKESRGLDGMNVGDEERKYPECFGHLLLRVDLELAN